MNSRIPIRGEGIPAELQRATPRHVVLTASGRVAVLWGIALILGGVACGVGARVLAERDRTMREGIAREGVVTEAVVTNVVRRRGEDARTTVSYVYSADGREYSGQVRLRKRASAGIEPGTRLRIEYLASSPATSWLAGRPPQGVPIWLPLVAVPLALAGVTVLVAVNRNRRLLTYGRATEATVLRSKRYHHGAHGGGHGYHVEYEFRLLSGARRTGRFDVKQRAPEDGARIVIVYDADEPKRVMRYPPSLFRIST